MADHLIDLAFDSGSVHEPSSAQDMHGPSLPLAIRSPPTTAVGDDTIYGIEHSAQRSETPTSLHQSSNAGGPKEFDHAITYASCRVGALLCCDVDVLLR